MQKNKQFAIDNLTAVEPLPTIASGVEAGTSTGPEIPRILHFIYLANPDDPPASLQFSFVHYMAIRSALQVNKGFVAKLYYNCAPNSRYWDLVKPDIELVHVDAPDEVFGNPVKLFAHKTDVLKLQLLLEHGGIYLDLDTICQRPFDPLLDGRVVLGYEEAIANGSRTTVGLCNATIISPPRSEFLHLWYEAYRNFVGGPSGDAWNKFSVQIPMQLARDNPHLLRMEPAASFFWPSWDDAGIRSMFCEDHEFPEAFSFHLWQRKSWHLLKDLDVHTVKTIDTTYNKIARRFVATEETTAETSDYRPSFPPAGLNAGETMSDLASAPRARLVTAWATVVYVDAESGELRHGHHDSSPANLVFVADPDWPGPRRRGWLVHDAGGANDPLVCRAGRCICVSRLQSEGASVTPTVLELIPLERGLIAFKAGTRLSVGVFGRNDQTL